VKLTGLCIICLCGALLLQGCGTYPRHGLDMAEVRKLESDIKRRTARLSPEQEEQILALDPNHLTAADVRTTLANAPAPRIIAIHGGFASVIRNMVSFAEFLVGMGYPDASIKNASDGTYTFSPYEDSDLIAGVIAWYYEREGMRPMIVGHSQGGVQAVKVLRKLDSSASPSVAVWNPLTWQKEDREQITDPLTHQTRPVIDLTLPYVSAVGSGGVARMSPNQWGMLFVLRTIPDSVEEFTGFFKGPDLLGGDFLGYGSANHYKANGRAVVRNIRLPWSYDHRSIPDTKHLLESKEIVDWINGYEPTDQAPPEPKFEKDGRNILWAADVWYSIRKNWVIELQRLIRSQRGSG